MICWPATVARGEDYKTVMPAAAETYSLGAPVELGKIEQELKKLWQEGEGAMTRASLMNLAVYSEQPGSLNNNTQLMAKITENHACRAIVTEGDCRFAHRVVVAAGGGRGRRLLCQGGQGQGQVDLACTRP